MAEDLFAARPPKAVDGIRAGIGGWTFVPWRNNFYPAGLVQRRELEYASRHVSAIEINGTYYGTQQPATYARWRDETPDGFVFSAKAPRRIMQSRSLAKTGPQVEDFVGGIATLGAKLGPLVWQFDAGTRLERDAFEAFCALLPAAAGGLRLRHVLDVRDAGFIDAGFIALARRHGFATVYTDSPEHPSFADVTADFAYARLMRARSAVATGYTAAELDAIEREMPVIRAEVELLDAQIMTLDRPRSELDARRIRRARNRVLAARRELANRAAAASTPGGAA